MGQKAYLPTGMYSLALCMDGLKLEEKKNLRREIEYHFFRVGKKWKRKKFEKKKFARDLQFYQFRSFYIFPVVTTILLILLTAIAFFLTISLIYFVNFTQNIFINSNNYIIMYKFKIHVFGNDLLAFGGSEKKSSA